jgi:hypothetical protein
MNQLVENTEPTNCLMDSSALHKHKKDVFLYGIYLPVDSHHQHNPEADVSHSISVPPSFPVPSYGHILQLS